MRAGRRAPALDVRPGAIGESCGVFPAALREDETDAATPPPGDGRRPERRSVADLSGSRNRACAIVVGAPRDRRGGPAERRAGVQRAGPAPGSAARGAPGQRPRWGAGPAGADREGRRQRVGRAGEARGARGDRAGHRVRDRPVQLLGGAPEPAALPAEPGAPRLDDFERRDEGRGRDRAADEQPDRPDRAALPELTARPARDHARGRHAERGLHAGDGAAASSGAGEGQHDGELDLDRRGRHKRVLRRQGGRGAGDETRISST